MDCRICLALLVAAAVWASGCVGPTTPLGTVDDSVSGTDTSASTPADRKTSAAPADDSARGTGPRLEFSPHYQQVHAPYTWQVRIRDPEADPAPDPKRLRVFYNGLEVSDAARFQFQVEVVPDPSDGMPPLLSVRLPHLRLSELEEHTIVVRYTSASGEVLEEPHPFPVVRELAAQEPIVDPGPFTIEDTVRRAIYEAGEHYRINPALIGALIAQESSFNPHALSKAKALGLTQVTHLTEQDIARHFPEWPRYPEIRSFSRRTLRRLIPDVINQNNEWRLDAEKSIRGGVHYLAYLRDRLRHPANREVVHRGGPDPDRVVTEAMLAAYNSGLNRTLYGIKTRGEAWLDHPRLREAKRYVRKVMSYYGMFRDGKGRGDGNGGSG